MNTEERIAALESRLRTQRFALVGMGLGLAVALGLGMTQEASKKMTLEQLVITKDGVPRVVIGTNPQDGGVGIACLDTKNKARVLLGTDSNGDGGMGFMDEEEMPRIAMGTGDGKAGIQLFGDAGIVTLPEPKDKDKD